jgi:hypothetical protein
MSNKKKKYLSAAAKQAGEQVVDKEKEELRSALIIVYFLAAFGFTTYATDHHMLTYGQIAVVYLPMFFIFIYWQIDRLRKAENGHTRLGNIVAIIMCLFIIIVTSCITVGAWLGMLQ